MHRMTRSVALATLIACGLAATALPAAAGQPAARTVASSEPAARTCPSAVPIAAVHRGMQGTGWTVAHGTKPQPFRVKVLGRLAGGINAGVDMIIAKVSDVSGSHMIAAAGGIWAGISGSPVYVGNRLLGSVSYSLTGSPSPIAGITPAVDMLPLLAYPSATSAARAAATQPAMVHLPASTARRVAHAAHTSLSAASTLRQIPMVLTVSGLNAAGRSQLAQRLHLAGEDAVVVPGASAPAPSHSAHRARPVAGGNFATLVSYGDVTSGAIGTTTYVCGHQALAFGHPFAFTGAVAYGANDANAIAVIKDSLFGSFKLANIGRLFGVLDQDRLTGVRANLNRSPSFIPVSALVKAPELGRQRTGVSRVTSSDFVPQVAPSHLFADMLTTFDSEGPGTAAVRFTVHGNRQNGTPFTFDRTNEFMDQSSIANAAPEELFEDLSILFANGSQPITFRDVSITATVTSDTSALNLHQVLVSRNGGPFHPVDSLNLARGSSIAVRGIFDGTDGGTVTRTVTLTVPANAPVGAADLLVGGGSDTGNDCFFDPQSCGSGFSQLLHTLESTPANNSLAAVLVAEGSGEFPVTVAQQTAPLPAVAFGSQDIFVTIH
jgi:hypothetical protein